MSEKKTFTSNGVTIEYENNSDEILRALENAVQVGLALVGEKAVDHAVDLVPVDTGNLKNSITYQVDGEEVYIGTNVLYAPYIEFGTGVYAESGGRKTPWTYKDDKGNWHHTNGYEPHPFLRPAATQHADEYRSLLEQALRNA